MFAAASVPIANGNLVDIGSGAGFPGLALKLVAPELTITLIEANAKKAAFLAEVVRTLQMKDVKIISKRAAELGDLDHCADYVTCRAVRVDKRLLAWMRSALRANGKCVLWLGAADAEKLRDSAGWHWKPAQQLPKSANRVLLVGSPAEK
jgi:16S rRNA (guanine527-N7)-methyltransferase